MSISLIARTNYADSEPATCWANQTKSNLVISWWFISSLAFRCSTNSFLLLPPRNTNFRLKRWIFLFYTSLSFINPRSENVVCASCYWIAFLAIISTVHHPPQAIVAPEISVNFKNFRWEVFVVHFGEFQKLSLRGCCCSLRSRECWSLVDGVLRNSEEGPNQSPK